MLPRLPRRLDGAFSYQPDHVRIEYPPTHGGKPVRLDVDYALFLALEKLNAGFPRHLLPDRDINRLDAFLEQLRCSDVEVTNVFLIHNHNDRSTAKVTLSFDGQRYEKVEVKGNE
jgi:hypothetical protein